MSVGSTAARPRRKKRLKSLRKLTLGAAGCAGRFDPIWLTAPLDTPSEHNTRCWPDVTLFDTRADTKDQPGRRQHYFASAGFVTGCVAGGSLASSILATAQSFTNASGSLAAS